MTIKPTKNGKEIEENLSNVNLDPWYYIYENYIKDEPKEKLEQPEKEQDSSD
jgi:hypothetical protein